MIRPSGIRHPEELSFAKPLEGDDLRYNYREREAAASSSKKKSVVAASPTADTNTFIAHHQHGNSTHSSNSSLDAKGPSGCTPVVPHSSSRSPAHQNATTPISSPVSCANGTRNVVVVVVQFHFWVSIFHIAIRRAERGARILRIRHPTAITRRIYWTRRQSALMECRLSTCRWRRVRPRPATKPKVDCCGRKISSNALVSTSRKCCCFCWVFHLYFLLLLLLLPLFAFPSPSIDR